MAVVKADTASILSAASVLRAGGLVAFPTETVYGLGADATNGAAVARIFEAKGRPRFNPLIVHVPDLAAAEVLAVFSGDARRLANAFWPGPLTMVLARKPGCGLSELVSAGLDTVAIRCPRHRVAAALLKAAGRPLAAPSANRSGHVSATEAEHVAADLGERVTVVLDDGATVLGLESTVLELQATASDRAGAIARGMPVPIEQRGVDPVLRQGDEVNSSLFCAREIGCSPHEVNSLTDTPLIRRWRICSASANILLAAATVSLKRDPQRSQ